MNGIKISEYFRVIKPQYVYLRLKPNNSIRNNSTHKLSKSIASLYRNVTESVKKEEAKLIKILGKEFLFGTKFSFEVNSKVSYFIYIEKKKVEFYFIIPSHYQSIIREKISDVWSGITIEEVAEIPLFSAEATKYQLVYKKEDALSIAVNRANNDLLNSNLNVIDVLEDGDKVGIFYNFIPTSQFSWSSTYQNTLQKIKSNMPVDRNKVGVNYLFKVAVGVMNNLATSISEVFSGSSSKSHDANISILESVLERMNGGKRISDSTQRKATASILNTQIVVMSESLDALRQRNNARSLVQSFDTIADDNALIAKPYRKMFRYTDYSIAGVEINKMGDEECHNFLSLPGRDILEKHNVIDKVETKETQVPEDLRKGVMRIGVSTFRGNEQPAYLSTDKEYKNLTLVLIGPTRAGKSTLIGNMSYDAIKAGECVVIFDYIGNCELSDEVVALFPPDKVLNIECGDFERLQGLGYNEVGYSDDVFVQYDNAKRQTTQLATLVNSINTDDVRLSAKMERYLTSASLVVFINGGSIRDVFQVLTDHNTRERFIAKVPLAQSENMSEYITSLHELDEYNKDGELNGTKSHLITGIIDRLNKLKANTYMELMLKKGTENNINLVDELQRNQLICLKMPETMFSTDGERDVYTTYWMTKLWLALQERKARVKVRDKLTKVNLVIDELYQVANTERFLTDKLSRLAKFGIKPIISAHYLNQIKQIREELRSANASYMLISGCDKKNFDELKSELYPFEEEDLLRLRRFHSLNLIKNKDGYARFITKLPRPVGEHYEKGANKNGEELQRNVSGM